MKEEPLQEELHGDLKRRGGRELRKQEIEVSPEPVITVGRGKRKKVWVIFLFLFLQLNVVHRFSILEGYHAL